MGSSAMRAIAERVRGDICESQFERRLGQIAEFERMLASAA